MCTAMMVMTFALTFAGVRPGPPAARARPELHGGAGSACLFYWVRLGSGVFVVISALMFVWAVLVPGRAETGSQFGRVAASRVRRDTAAARFAAAAR